MRIFVGWDAERSKYFVCGKRQSTWSMHFAPFYFALTRSKEVWYMLRSTLPLDIKLNMTLLNTEPYAQRHCRADLYDYLRAILPLSGEIANKSVRIGNPEILRCIHLLQSTATATSPSEM